MAVAAPTPPARAARTTRPACRRAGTGPWPTPPGPARRRRTAAGRRRASAGGRRAASAAPTKWAEALAPTTDSERWTSSNRRDAVGHSRPKPNAHAPHARHSRINPPEPSKWPPLRRATPCSPGAAAPPPTPPPRPGARGLPGPDRVDPVGQVEQLAVGLVVEVAPLRPLAEDHLLGLALARVRAPARTGRGRRTACASVPRNSIMAPWRALAERPLEVHLHVRRGSSAASARCRASPTRPCWRRARRARRPSVGWSRSRNQWATSTQWTIRSVKMPPPKSQNQRQLRKRYSSNGCVLRRAEERLPVHRLRVDAELVAADAVGVAVPAHADLDDLAEPAGLDQLAGLLDVRHAPLLRADLHDLLRLRPRRRGPPCPRPGRASAASRRTRPCRPRRRRWSSGRASGPATPISTASMSLRASSCLVLLARDRPSGRRASGPRRGPCPTRRRRPRCGPP